MNIRGLLLAGFASAIFAACLGASPAHAQIFWLPPETQGTPATAYDPDLGVPLPGATPAEQKAAIIWNMRSGLNVAALQCGFAPTLRTAETYNSLIYNHSAELSAAFASLAGYFKRTNKAVKAGQTALDKFGTKTYSGFSAVSAQLNFCSVAGKVAQVGLFTPRGQFAAFAQTNLRELRNGLRFQGEQQFRFRPVPRNLLPTFDKKCWKRDQYKVECGYW